jgi:outer membrane protein assembly factor BamA
MNANQLLRIAIILVIVLWQLPVSAQKQDSGSVKKDTMSKFDARNAKMEALFKVIPVPIFSYSTEAGYVFGLAKFNLINLVKEDTISAASRLSEVATFSTEGQINISVSTDLNWHQGRYMVLGYINYKQQPEYILGIGNDVSRDSVEAIEVTRLKFVNYGMIQFVKNFYAGIGVDLTNYLDVQTDSNSYLIRNNVAGIEGGTGVGLGFSAAYDTRDNRYNPYKGMYAMLKTMTFPSFLGNPYLYSSVDFDIRKYYNPWFKHVIAVQATTSYRSEYENGAVPFYELALMGGEDKMRGYYKGALRDHVLMDAQLEYRMPIWKILGATAFVGTGRVAPSYSEMSLDGLWVSYGFGLRLKVDSAHNTNLRFDWGFGPGGINGFYINFAEAF